MFTVWVLLMLVFGQQRDLLLVAGCELDFGVLKVLRTSDMSIDGKGNLSIEEVWVLFDMMLVVGEEFCFVLVFCFVTVFVVFDCIRVCFVCIVYTKDWLYEPR